MHKAFVINVMTRCMRRAERTTTNPRLKEVWGKVRNTSWALTDMGTTADAGQTVRLCGGERRAKSGENGIDKTLYT